MLRRCHPPIARHCSIGFLTWSSAPVSPLNIAGARNKRTPSHIRILETETALNQNVSGGMTRVEPILSVVRDEILSCVLDRCWSSWSPKCFSFSAPAVVIPCELLNNHILLLYSIVSGRIPPTSIFHLRLSVTKSLVPSPSFVPLFFCNFLLLFGGNAERLSD